MNPFDPAASEIVFEVFSGGAPVYRGVLFPGDVRKRGNKWKFLDRKAKKTGGVRDGISLFEVTQRAGIWKFHVKIRRGFAGDLDPLVRVMMSVDGDVVYDREEEWLKRRSGLYFDLGRN